MEQQHFYLFTSYLERETIINALSAFNIQDDGESIQIPALDIEITDGDDYFLQQREGMLNFFSSLINADHMETQSKFLMHLATCVKGYKISFTDTKKLTPVSNALITKTQGLLFTPAMQFFIEDWKLLMDANGDCDVAASDYNVGMSASTFDADVVSSDESETRKQRTIALLKSKSIHVLESLPTIPSSDMVTERSEHEVSKRILALAITAVKGELKSKDIPLQVFNKYQMEMEDVSAAEFQIIDSEDPNHPEYTNATWRYESLNALMWACGYMDDIYFPSDIVDVGSMIEIIRDSIDFEVFLLNANMRDMDEILDELDLNYRLHWACVDARINDKPAPEGVNPSVVYERHYALNWLINRYNEDWDNVSTPT